MNQTGSIRRLSLLILLVAASAVAMRNDREISELYSRNWGNAVTSRWPMPVRTVVGTTLRLGSDLKAALLVMTVGLGLSALRRPFVPAGKRWPGRGMAAIAVSGLAVGFAAIRVGLEAAASQISGDRGLWYPHFFSDALRNCEGPPQGSVLGAWSLLILAGRWDSEADGLERLGRLLGWSWLASIAFDNFHSTLLW